MVAAALCTRCLLRDCLYALGCVIGCCLLSEVAGCAAALLLGSADDFVPDAEICVAAFDARDGMDRRPAHLHLQKAQKGVAVISKCK